MTRSPAVSFWARLERLLVIALVLFPPLFVWLWGFEGYMFPKRILIAMITAALGGVVAWRAIRGEASFRMELNPINGIFVLFWIWNVVSMFWASSLSLAVERVVWLGIIGIAMFLVQSHLVGNRGSLLRLGKWLILTVVLLGIWCLFMDFWGLFSPETLPVSARLGDWRDRISVAGLGNTGHIADFLVLAFPTTLLFYLHSTGLGRRVVGLVALGILAAALIITWSVHSNASLIVVIALGLPALLRLHRSRWWKRAIQPIAVVCVVWVGVVLFYVLPHALNPHPGGIFREAFGSERWEAGWPTRIAIWSTSLDMVRENVFLGVGTGNFTYAYPAIDSQLVKLDPELMMYAHRWTNAAHNVFIQMWAETGIVGLALGILVLTAPLVVMGRRYRRESVGNRMILWAAMLSLGAWILQGQMNFPLQMPVATLWLVFLASIPVVLPTKEVFTPSSVLFPVEIRKAGIRFTLYVRNMRVPCRMALETEWTAGMRWGAGVVLVLGVGLVLTAGVRGLKAEIALREGKQKMVALQDPRFAFSPAVPRRIFEWAGPHFEQALRLWPWLTDARSALTELQVRAGEYEAALESNRQVRKRLDATEVYFREAWSRSNLGQIPEAMAAMEVIRSRSLPPDFNRDGVPDNLSLDPYWTAVYVELGRRAGVIDTE